MFTPEAGVHSSTFGFCLRLGGMSFTGWEYGDVWKKTNFIDVRLFIGHWNSGRTVYPFFSVGGGIWAFMDASGYEDEVISGGAFTYGAGIEFRFSEGNKPSLKAEFFRLGLNYPDGPAQHNVLMVSLNVLSKLSNSIWR